MVHSSSSPNSSSSSSDDNDNEREDMNNITLQPPLKKKRYNKSKSPFKSVFEDYRQALSRLEQVLTEKSATTTPNNNNEKPSSISSSPIETQLPLGNRNQVVKLNIGGEKYFTTTLTTLTSIPHTFFTGYFNEQFNPQPESIDNAYFIDRPSKHFDLILNHLRGKNIKENIKEFNDRDLFDFIEEVIFYQITTIYDLLPPKGKKHLYIQYGIELMENNGLKESSSSEIMKFDPNYCSSKITLELSETIARCNQDSDGGGSVLGTLSKSFKVLLISNCSELMNDWICT